MRRALSLFIFVFSLLVTVAMQSDAAAIPQIDGKARNLRVFVCGPPECGKSSALKTLFVSKTDRVITIDINGEAAGEDPNAIPVYGIDGIFDALNTLASRRRWHIAAFSLEPKDYDRLFATLSPVMKSESATSYTKLVGGVAIACAEAAEIFPNGRTSKSGAGALNRARHHLLSLYMGTQRPQDVHKALTSFAHTTLVFPTFGHRELQHWRENISPPVAELLPKLEQYHSIVYRPGRRYVQELDPNYRPVRTITFDGVVQAA